jgi:hypothetical protein
MKITLQSKARKNQILSQNISELIIKHYEARRNRRGRQNYGTNTSPRMVAHLSNAVDVP